MRIARFLSLCAIALVSAASFVRARTAVFNITSIQSSTGSLGSTGVGCGNAAIWFQRWLNETKAGVVYSAAANVNYTLRITHANDHSNATLNALLTAASVTGTAADGSPAPNLLIGPHSSLAIASSSICEAARTLNFQLAGPNYIYEAGKKYLYGTAASSYRYTELFIKTMSLSQPSVASVAIVWNSGAPFTVTTCQQAQNYAQTATRALNVSLFAPYTTQADGTLTAPALAALLEQLRQTRADVLIVCSFVTDGIQLAPALHDLDFQHQAVFMTVAPTNAAWAALGAKGHHVFTPTQWVPSLQYTNVLWPDGEFANPQKFADSYQAMFGLAAEYTMVNCLNHYLVIYEALRQSPSASVADLRAALGRMNIFTMLGRVQFDAATNQNTYLDPITLQVQPAGGGGGGGVAVTARSVFPTDVAEALMVFPSQRYIDWFLAQPLPGADYYIDTSAAVPVVRRCAAGWQNFNATRCVRVPTYNTLRAPVTAALYAFAGLCACISVAIGALLFALRERSIMRATAPFIGLWTCVGGLLCGAAVAALAAASPSDANCQASLWLTSMAYICLFGSLFIRTFRIDSIFNSKNLNQSRISDLQLGGALFVLIAVDAALLLAWQFLDPQTSVLVRASATEDSVFSYSCSSKTQVGSGIGYALIVYKFCITVWGIVLAYRTRGVMSNFNESRGIAIAIYNCALMCAILLPIAFALTAAAPQFVTALRGFLTGYIGVFSLAILYAERLYLIATGADEEMAAHSVAVGALSRQPSALHRMHSMPVSQPHAADAADIELAVSASASALSPKSKLSASSASAAAAAQPRKPRELSSARVRRSSNFFASNRNQLQGSAGCADASSSSSSSSSSGARPSLMLRSSVFQQQAGIAAGAMGAGSSSVSVGGSGLITAQRFDAFATEMRAAHSQLRRSLRGALQETRADHRVNAAFRAELARLLPVAAAAAHTALECGRDGHGHGAHGDRSNGSAADESDDDEGDDDQSGIWLKTAPLEQTSELKSAAPCSDRSTAPSPAQHVTLNLTSLRESASEQSAATLNARLAEQEAPTTSRQPPSVESVLRKFMTLNSNAAKPTPDIALASPSDARKDARALNGSDAAAKISQRASASPLRAPLSVQTVSPLLAPAALSLELPPMSLPSPFALASSARGSAESQTVASMPQALRRQESTALAPSSSTASLSSSSSSASLRASATNLRGVSASAVPDSALSAMLTTLTQWHASPVDTSAGTSASGRGNDDRSGSAFSGAKQP